MNLKPALTKAVASLVFVAAASSAHATGVFQEFTINEGSVPGAVANTIVADKINGGYAEALTINTNLSFASTAYADFGQYYKNDGTTLVTPSLLNAPTFLTSAGYGLYALFQSSGQLTSSGFVGATGAFSLYVDPNQDTVKTLGATGSSAVILGNNSDDYLVAFSTTAIKLLGLPGTPGAYDFIFTNFSLTATDQDPLTAGVQSGKNFFVSPDPFHSVVDVNGDFDAFNAVVNDVNSRILAGTFTTTTYKGVSGDGLGGDLSAVFPVPEPASLALVGLGLFAAGMSRRRKAA